MTVVIINTGTANLASVRAAFDRLGQDTVIAEDASTIAHAKRLVLPGVGSFASGMDRLTKMNVANVITEHIGSGQPLLAVCLGLQLLCQRSEESPGVSGLGVIDTDVARFRSADIVPQLGWNRVEPGDGSTLVAGYAYYANSYRLTSVPAGWQPAFTTHGERFVAAVERDRLLACQFHPELSGAWGQQLLAAWLERGASC